MLEKLQWRQPRAYVTVGRLNGYEKRALGAQDVTTRHNPISIAIYARTNIDVRMYA